MIVYITLLGEKLTTITNVLKQLVSIDTRWREIGNGLHVGFNYLDGLAKDNTMSNQIRLQHVLQKWKDLDSPAALVTWKTVIDVVKGPFIENEALAKEMYKLLKHKNSTVTSKLLVFISFQAMNIVQDIEYRASIFQKACNVCNGM